MGVQRAKPSVDHRNDRNPYTQCARQGVNLGNSPGDCFPKRGRPAREVAPLKHSRYGHFFFLDNILGRLTVITKTGTLFSREKFANIGFPCKPYFPLLCAKGKHGVLTCRSERPAFSQSLFGFRKPLKLPRKRILLTPTIL